MGPMTMRSRRGTAAGARELRWWWQGPVPALVAALTAAVALVVFDTWFVNFDGGVYLALAKALRHLQGYRFPDGTPVLERGPGYAGWLAAAWLVLPMTAKTAMWASRLVLVADAVLVALLVRRASGSPLGGTVAGVAAALSPLPFISGGLFFVPDALAAGLVLAALLVLTPAGAPESLGGRRLLVAGALLGLAIVTKESAVFGVLVAVLYLLSGYGMRGRNGRQALLAVGAGTFLGWVLWPVWAALAAGMLPAPFTSTEWVGWVVVAAGLPAAGLAAVKVWPAVYPVGPARPLLAGVSALLLAAAVLFALEAQGGADIRPWSSLWGELWTDIDRQMYHNSHSVIAAVGGGAALLRVAVRPRRRAEVVALLLIGAGLGAGLYAVRTGTGLRNGVLAGYGLAVAAGLLVVPLGRWRPRLTLGLGAGLVAFFLVGNTWALASTNGRYRPHGQTLVAPATETAARWVDAQAADPVMASPPAAAAVWFLEAGSRPMALTPIYTGNPLTEGPVHFSAEALWFGSKLATPAAGDRPVAVTVARTTTTAVFLGALNDALERTGSRYLVVTGNYALTGASLDGGMLLPFLEEASGARRVFTASAPGFPQWVVVYRVDPPLRSPDGAVYVHRTVDVSVPAFGPHQVVADDAAYEAMIRRVLGAAGSASDTLTTASGTPAALPSRLWSIP